MWSEDGQKYAVSYLQQPPVARQAVAHLFMPLDDHHGIPAMCHVCCLVSSVKCCKKFLIVTFPHSSEAELALVYIGFMLTAL